MLTNHSRSSLTFLQTLPSHWPGRFNDPHTLLIWTLGAFRVQKKTRPLRSASFCGPVKRLLDVSHLFHDALRIIVLA